jgi:hypothetical protein
MYTLQPLPVHETNTAFNMHQTMTEKIIHNRGIAYLTFRQHLKLGGRGCAQDSLQGNNPR